MMPVEVDPPSKISWDSRADWEDVLRKFVAEGRTDFLPISTTARGSVSFRRRPRVRCQKLIAAFFFSVYYG